jgi:acyl-CoA synthetase (AMP-forming)/AMP-acid ligase II
MDDLHRGVYFPDLLVGAIRRNPARPGLAVLANSRPEVLFVTGASTLTPTRNTPLHPLGSLEDHASVVRDAGIEALVFFQFYGQTEAPQTVCVLRKEDHDPDDLARLATCGRPVPWVHVALLDDEGNEVPRGEPGEICVRGPLVMSGYRNKPEQTAEALRGGWLHTGKVLRARYWWHAGRQVG